MNNRKSRACCEELKLEAGKLYGAGERPSEWHRVMVKNFEKTGN